MPAVSFQRYVTTPDELTAVIGTPGPLSLKKELNSLDEHMRRFIAHSPFVVISTCDKEGNCDASPRGDGPGFVQVLDDSTLLIPDRPGNKRVDSMRNILQTGRIGVLFLVPGFGETLQRLEGDGKVADARTTLLLEASWATHSAAGDDFGVTLYGTEGGVELMVRNYGYDNTVRVFTDIGGVPVDSAPKIPKGKGHLHVIERFVAAILDGAPPIPSAEEGLRRVEVIAACYRSALEGREVPI